MRIADARPGLVLAGTALVAAVALPLAVWRWAVLRNAFFGDVTIGAAGARATTIDPRWIYPLLGLLALVSYGSLAGFALVASRRASPRVRNLISIAMLPVFFVLVWLWVGGAW
jgi:hypothetical protein